MIDYKEPLPPRRDGQLFHEPTEVEFWRPDDREAEARVVAAFEQATPEEIAHGKTWYSDVHEFARGLADAYELEKSLSPDAYVHVAGIIAILSPRLVWEQNMEAAETLVRDRTYNGLTRATDGALAMLDGEHPERVLYREGSEGYKVQAFFDNIRDPDNSNRVTLDRHMWNLLYSFELPLQIVQAKGGRETYEWGEDRIRAAAAELGMPPLQLQAIDWVVWRRLHGNAPKQAATANQPRLFD